MLRILILPLIHAVADPVSEGECVIHDIDISRGIGKLVVQIELPVLKQTDVIET